VLVRFILRERTKHMKR